MALERSDLTLACSEVDALAFGEDYGIDPSKVVVIENGVDALGVPHVPSEVLAQLRSRLGLEHRLCAVFGGSFHHPNFLAAERILRVAQQVPDMIFVILGSVCNHPMFRNLSAANVRNLGQVEESVKWMAFQAADLGLNPMELGSGTNIKMFEYAASALPAVSTAFGARGIPMEPDTEYLPVEIDDLPRVLAGMSIADRDRLAEIGQRARRKVTDLADWTVIGRRYRGAVRDVCA
jgi:glycosyltransferase involved in cell wall biosynthesis